MHSILVRAALNAKRSTFNIADMSNIRDGALYLSVRKLNFKARLFAKKGLTQQSLVFLRNPKEISNQ
jgi:hypothetical protein